MKQFLSLFMFGIGGLFFLAFFKTRPCPAIIPPASSTRTGVVQPHSLMEAAIWAIWASE
jgi:hypothetical protein